MKDLVQCTVTCDGFHHWLLCAKTPATVHMEKEPSALLIKLEKSPSVLYLYRTPTVQDRGISWNNSMLFCGVYNKQNQALYLTKDALSIFTDGQIRLVTTVEPSMTDEICSRINQRVEETIANDRNNLSVREVIGWQAVRKLKEYLEDGARRESLDLFFSNSGPDGQFHSGYTLDNLPEAAFMAWLQDPEGFIQTEADQHIKVNQEKFLLQFLKNDALAAEYQVIVQDPDNPLHRVKAISEAIKTSGAKTVTVTVQKDGGELSFRTGTTPLRGRYNSYNTSHIAAFDRQEFERLFGRHASYTAEDIIRITYGKRTLYEAPPIQSEGMTESMEMGGMQLG